MLVLEIVEFVYATVAQPILGKHHDYFNHHHLAFDQAAGQKEFRKTANRIFARNGVVFGLLSAGRIVRVLLKENGRIESKWGQLGLYEYALFEVPANYGESIRFYKPIDFDKGIGIFYTFAETLGVQFE